MSYELSSILKLRCGSYPPLSFVVVVLEVVSNILVKDFRFSSTSTRTKRIRLDRMQSPCAFFYFSEFRIFSRGIVPPYRTTTGPTSEFKGFCPLTSVFCRLYFAKVFLIAAAMSRLNFSTVRLFANTSPLYVLSAAGS